MAWDKGWNFRDTAAYVTDGTNETYVLIDSYPTTRNGVTFGWAAGAQQSRDRDSTVDRRLAGINFQANNGAQSNFRVDLPSTADYIVTLALGDTAYSQGYQYWRLLDNTTVLATIDDTNGTVGDNYDDATGVNRAEADWPSQNATIQKTFASTTLNVKIGAPTAQADSSTLAHLFLSQVAAGGLSIPVAAQSYRQRRVMV